MSKKNKWEELEKEINRQEADKSSKESVDPKSDKSELDQEDIAADLLADDLIDVSQESSSDFSDELDADMDVDAETIALRGELKKNKEQVLALMAKIKNQDARNEREMQKSRQFANERMIKKLLPVIDSLGRGLESSPGEDSQAQSLYKGMEMTHDMLLKVLQEFGVTIINPQAGDAFDPDSHEAMTVQQDDKHEDNTVLQTLQHGYALQGRVLRAAMVIVNRL